MLGIVAVAAGCGVPPFSTFLGELRTLAVSFHARAVALAVVIAGVIGLFITFFYYLLGATQPSAHRTPERPLPNSYYLVFFVLAVPLVVIYFTGARLML